MDNSLKPPHPDLNRRARGRSCPTFNPGDSDTLCNFGRDRLMFYSAEQINTTYNTPSSWFSLELLYNITDIVLVICAAVFIISSITSIVLWMYGFPIWRNSEKTITFQNST